MVRMLGLRAYLLLLLFWQILPAFSAGAEGMAPGEIVALQRRLTDAKCYAGPVDGNASAALDRAIVACPSQTPQLRIETSMHVATIWRIGVDAACRIAATGSADKTVRLWSLPDGQLLRTLRWPIGPGSDGKVLAVAVSPDGRWVATGGWDLGSESRRDAAIYIFDAATGVVEKRIGGFGQVIDHLAFSADGHWLAVAMYAHGIKVINTASWTVAAVDTNYAGPSPGAAFGPDGRLYAVAYDGKLRRYAPGPSLRKERETVTRSGKQPHSVAVDPAGKLLALGFNDSTTVDFYDAATLRFRGHADTRGVNGNLRAAWRSDGAQLIAGGMYKDRNGSSLLLAFDRVGRRTGEPLLAGSNSILDIQPCGGGFGVSSADPAFGFVSGDASHKPLWRYGVAPDVRAALGEVVTVSADARRVRFRLGYGSAEPVTFDLIAGTLLDDPGAGGLNPPRIDGLPVAGWKGTAAPSLAGKPIKLDPYEVSRSLAVRPTDDGFVLGAAYALRAFDGSGNLRWKQAASGETMGVNLSADGRIVIAAYGDGTVRWHRWSDGRELLALFVNRETKAWVAWTPSGYYMASAGGEDMIGWHVNRGWDQAADFFPASRFRDRFNRSDIVQLVLDTLDEAAAVEKANVLAKRRSDTRPIIARLPPVVTILSPADGSRMTPGEAEIRYGVRSPSGTPVDRVDVFVNGAKITPRGLVRPGGATGALTFAMPAHDATISIVAFAGSLASDAARVELKSSDVSASPSAKPVLYALLVGVSRYEDSDLDLAYAAKDANDLAETLKMQRGRLYEDVQVKVLTDKEATAVAVKDGLAWLAAHASDRDLELLFVAGHGLTDAKGRFWFLTHDADPARVSSTALSRDDFTGVLYDLPGKKIMFLDACHSGSAVDERTTRGLARGPDVSSAINDFAQAEGGVVAFAASTGREFSFERAEWGHGAFTKALIEALDGKADLLHTGTITTATLDAYVAERVKELTGGHQHAVMTRPKTVPDFPVAFVR